MRISAVLLLALVACSHAKPTAAPAPIAKAAPPDDGRFDFKVRQDFFDGMRGDQAALDRAMAACDEALAKDPKNAEAMVWHGAGVVQRASVAFRAGDKETGISLWTQGLAEMDHAVELAPKNVGVRIPRGAVLLASAPFVPEPQRSQLLTNGVADYEATLSVQEAYFTQLTLHSREQLLYGLTDGYALLGDLGKAKTYFGRMQREAVGSEIMARAEARSRGEAVQGQTPCEQCHNAR